MSGEMRRRALDGGDLVELEARVKVLVEEFTRRSVGQDQDQETDQAPVSGEETADEERGKAVQLARAAVYRHVERVTASALADDLTEVLLYRGADFHDLAGVLGPDHGWSDRLRRHTGVAVPRGEHTVVVIEHGTVRTPGSEADAHAADRGPWPIEDAVRAQAQYAVVTEDGVMRRVYRLRDWQETQPGRWTFAGRELTPREIRDGYDRGLLPLYVPTLSLEFRLHTAAGTAAEPGARAYRFRCQCRR
ncbi:hypothetical protein ACWD0J_20905 [Streptomyces sp. NPDC003011]